MPGTESKIDTKLFTSTADAVIAVAKDLESCFSDWAKIMSSLRSVWQGDTSDDMKNTIESVQRSASELLRSLGGYKAALYELAGIYDNTEKNIQEKSRSLKFERPLR